MITIFLTLVVFAVLNYPAYIFGDVCPNDVKCQGRCCVNQQNDYYCCPNDQNYPDEHDRVYLVGLSSWWKDYWGVIIGCLIASIVISVILSVLCCLFCNGCWWHKRRNNGVYGGGFPLGGAFIYTPYPPPWYDDSSCSSDRTGRQHRVHFDDDLSSSSKTYEAPKSALKNKNVNGTVPNGGV